MKKLFLFIGVIIFFLIFSCKKDSPPPPPPPIDSFLLHPPPVFDSLPIPLTIGTWWKYQRNDSSEGPNPICCVIKMVDSSIELITVIGKVPIVDTAYEVKNNTITRTRFDTVSAFMLEEKNLTKGTVDTIYIYYYNAAIWIFSFNIKVPLIEGTQNIYGQGSYRSTNIVNKNTSVIIFNKTYDNCIYYEDSFSSGWPSGINGNKNIYLKPGVGIVDWQIKKGSFNQYSGTDSKWVIRRLIDYHIAT